METRTESIRIGKRLSARIAGIFCGMALTATPLMADQVSTAAGFGPFQIGSGGEFTVIPDQALFNLNSAYSPLTKNFVQDGSFQTFCVERNEVIAPGTTYDVTFSSVTMFSGVPLTVGAAYLYQQFALGTLPYNFTDTPAGSRTGYTAPHFSAYELQHAIWYFMGDYSYDQYNVYMNGVVPLPANPFAADNGAHNVSVLNLWAPGQKHDPAHAYQDLLVYMPVPEPTVFALSGLGFAALLISRRKK
jgi:hypothetical protein